MAYQTNPELLFYGILLFSCYSKSFRRVHKAESLSERKKPLAGRLLAFVLWSLSSRAHFDLPRGGGSSILKTQDNPTSVARNRKCTELTLCSSYLYQHTQGRQVISEGIAGFKQRDPVGVESSSARGSCGRTVLTSERKLSNFAPELSQLFHNRLQTATAAQHLSLLQRTGDRRETDERPLQSRVIIMIH